MEMQINVNTKIIYMDSAVPVMRAIENVKRDIRKVCCDSDEKGCDIVLIMENMQAEQFEIKCDNNMLVIYASDTLEFVYGLYHISRDILGVLPFWFWNDQVFIKKKGCRISGEYAYTSKPYAVKYRGWFVNDEVLIHKWYVDRKKDMPWEMVFEALLRCGGNLVIPGTDKNSHIYRDLAADMGLRITHHHAEPLGAPMFARRYPELTPSYDEYPEKFHELWKEGIDEQKKLDVIWNLGFRGQGDCPFWDNDPRYQTSESRGELMGKLIGLQRDYVQNEIPDAQYCTNLYGETMELYRDGYLKLPDDVIKIWADNGFGKMVTRRQGNHNPRIPALPKENNTGRHGIYYHVSFYDLQAANHITMLPNKPKLVHSELKKVLEHHVKDYWIINCSNVKPHVYYLDFIANMWRDGDVDIDNYIRIFTQDETFRQALKVTFIYVLFLVPLRLAFALLVAMLLNKKHKCLGLYRTIYYIPSIIGGSIAVSIVWRQIFGNQGVVMSLLSVFGINQKASFLGNPHTALGVIILMGVWQFGSSMLIFLAALKQIPGSLYESAMVDGAKQWTMFWKITLPMLTPTIFFNLILQIVNGFRVFTESYVITDGGPLDSTLSYVLYLYRRAFTYFDMGYSCALAWILVIIIAVFTIVLFKTQNNWVHYETGGDE